MKRLFTVCLVLFISACGKEIEPSPRAAWTQLASMPTARSENAAVVVGPVIHVAIPRKAT